MASVLRKYYIRTVRCNLFVGIRMALRAARSRVLAQVMTQGFLVTTIGGVAGLAAAFGLNRVIPSLLFGWGRPTAPRWPW